MEITEKTVIHVERKGEGMLANSVYLGMGIGDAGAAAAQVLAQCMASMKLEGMADDEIEDFAKRTAEIAIELIPTALKCHELQQGEKQ